MGTNEKTYSGMVPYTIEISQSAEDCAPRKTPSVSVDIDGVSTLADFEVIEIIDDSNPYPALLGIEWVIDNDAVINLKKRQMNFEGKGMRVIVPLDPSQGERYTKPVRDEYQDALDHI